MPWVAAFTSDDVRRLAHLARLELSGEELELFTRQLQEILEFAQQINAVDTSSVPEATHGPAAAAGSLREDTVRGGLDRDDVLALAPEADRTEGLFKVPRVLNG
jgi:aspartyl-tRNA(Asn)/glutamyl-tRNA(Gln) amidotransferase subunit C